MATFPYSVLGPNTILSVVGLIRGPDRTIPMPAEDWRAARVDVVIPALNEARHISLCLASVLRQTLRPRQILLIDDGSCDDTVGVAERFCALQGQSITVIRRRAPIGKTPTLKRQARELDCDVLFILDADTVLESENYIERTVQELYQAVGIACACGTILPQRRSDRLRWLARPEVRACREADPSAAPANSSATIEAARAVTNVYRECLYLFLQKLIYRGQNTCFGTITNPVGCAVAYRAKYVRDLFDHFEPQFGDDLTNSEDIFIGFAMLDMGYRNIQLPDVYARTVEPPIYRVPRQLYLWSSAFLQSCYYFDSLLRSPLKSLGRWILGHARRLGTGTPMSVPASRGKDVASLTPALPGSGASLSLVPAPPMFRVSAARPPAGAAAARGGGGGADRRRVAEPYRQPFGRVWTAEHGRPAGWILLLQAIEKVFFPTTLLALIILGAWEGLLLTMAIETSIAIAVLALAMKGQRIEYLVKGLLIAPIRYVLLAMEVITIGRFAWTIWATTDRSWRK
jgi:glycosyltransferase involved in cell wall biosynthesis